MCINERPAVTFSAVRAAQIIMAILIKNRESFFFQENPVVFQRKRYIYLAREGRLQGWFWLIYVEYTTRSYGTSPILPNAEIVAIHLNGIFDTHSSYTNLHFNSIILLKWRVEKWM